MTNTGFKQAIIAFKIDAASRRPLDINGEFTEVSGLKQAIFLLVGTSNPDPLRLEVQGYFSRGSTLQGEATRLWAPLDCPLGRISVLPDRVVVPWGQNVIAEVTSDGAFTSSGPLTVSPPSGSGRVLVEIINPSQNGTFDVVFTNSTSGATSQIRIIVTDDPDAWILETGFWEMSAFWQSDGLWNY